MSIPFVIWVFVFHYVPVWGWIMAFQNYRPGLPFFEQEWIGLETLPGSVYRSLFLYRHAQHVGDELDGTCGRIYAADFFAIMLNELRGSLFKRTVQTVAYLPHFVSWVVVAGIVIKLLSIDRGAVNEWLLWLGIIDQPIPFMAKEKWFWWIVTAADAWKETGWNSIIFLAAIAGIDPELYEAARVDGAGRWRQIWHITLPGIRSVIFVLMILSIGNLISIGFEKQFLLSNPLVREYAEVLELYALNYGIGLARFSYGTAIGIFNSVISVTLLFIANGLFKRYANESVM